MDNMYFDVICLTDFLYGLMPVVMYFLVCLFRWFNYEGLYSSFFFSFVVML
ncbi:hypothetical protein NLO413_0327 [Candidatus Neoehrlichia lotoris str. RAC413]|uniref:Uncharacterized protein n=1 Tax=Candidatus Neoehrlichia procyonis str. RAC413 TaxID=1359163 RepID=A0A0F3NLN1_9RICK|nr:hypothetical protein NLO413_0327 [Candidatus Neoehrlichia lotoris str. RAC413]